MSDFTSLILSNGRCIPLLKFLVNRWLNLKAICIVGTTEAIAKHLPNGCNIEIVSVAPKDHGSALQQLLEVSTTEYTLISADDILPIENDFVQRIPRNSGKTISSIQLLSVTGDRWYDWAIHKNGLSYLQDYEDHEPGTYISGGAQLISKEVIKSSSYADLGFHAPSDVHYCKRAIEAGATLYPPKFDGPTLIHLDRFTQHNRPKSVVQNHEIDL